MYYLLISVEIFGALLLVGVFVMGIIYRRFEIAIGAMVLFGATLWHANIAGRWSQSNISAEEFANRFQNVPMNIGDWEGTDLEVSATVQKGSGAVGYVSRLYNNKNTNESVRLWLIVGHGRDICQHRPTTCYRVHGAKQLHEPSRRKIYDNDTQLDEFWTTEFELEGDARDRIFWAWAKPPGPGEPIPHWLAPKVARMAFLNSKALYKVYFTTAVVRTRDPNQKRSTPCIDFAREFIPVLNHAIFADHPDKKTAGGISDEGTDAAEPAENPAGASETT